MISVLVLAGGESSRMKSCRSKVLHNLGGRRVIDYVLEAAHSISEDVLVVISDKLVHEIVNVKTLIQNKPFGTGDASLLGLKKCIHDNVLIIFGDTPLLKKETLEKMYAYHIDNNNTITIASTETKYAEDYGIINLNDDNQIVSILETKDVKVNLHEQHALLYNGGVMCVNKSVAIDLLEQVHCDREKYLTSIVSLVYTHKFKSGLFKIDFEETMGINTRQDLYRAECILQEEWRKKILEHNTVLDINSVFLSYNTYLRDVIIHPYVTFGPNVEAFECEILPYSYITHSKIYSGAHIGPSATVKHSIIYKDTVIGNFTELNRSIIGEATKIKHLAYIGDASIGSNSNVGAGAVICNYDGHRKHKTSIGNNAFIGANCSIIATTLGNNIVIGAGSVITENVDDNTLAIARARQVNKLKKSNNLEE